MQLSVDIQHQHGKTVYFCRGSLVQGQASDYLFDLVTRSGCDNIVLDLAGIRQFDAVGLQTLGLTWVFLNTCRCALALQHAPPHLMEQLCRKYAELSQISTRCEPELLQISTSCR